MNPDGLRLAQFYYYKSFVHEYLGDNTAAHLHHIPKYREALDCFEKAVEVFTRFDSERNGWVDGMFRQKDMKDVRAEYVAKRTLLLRGPAAQPDGTLASPSTIQGVGLSGIGREYGLSTSTKRVLNLAFRFHSPCCLRALPVTIQSMHERCDSALGENEESIEMKNPVGYFEIPVYDLDRAVRFYESVFGYQLARIDIDGHPMALFPLHDEAPGITGALAKGESYIPATEGSRLYFNTENIDETLARVLLNGGKILYPRTSIGDLGWVAEFQDVEGNCIALHSP